MTKTTLFIIFISIVIILILTFIILDLQSKNRILKIEADSANLNFKTYKIMYEEQEEWSNIYKSKTQYYRKKYKKSKIKELKLYYQILHLLEKQDKDK